MDISEAILALNKEPSIDCVIKAATSTPPTISAKSSQLDNYIDQIKEMIAANKYRESVIIFICLILFDANSAIIKSRKKGLFRSSQYKFQAKGVSLLLRAVYATSKHTNLSETNQDYLDSVKNLLLISPASRLMRNSIINRLEIRKNVVLKTLLVIINTVFSSPWVQNQELQYDELQFWSAEDLAEALSLLIELYRVEIGVHCKSWQIADCSPTLSTDPYYFSLITDAARLCQYREAEAYLDAVPYKADREGNQVIIRSSDPNLEKSVRLGFIQMNMQLFIRGALSKEYSETHNIPSIDLTISNLMTAGLSDYVFLRQNPFKRLVFDIPNIPVFLDLLKANMLFQEELPVIFGLNIDNFHGRNSRVIKVTPILDVMDIIKIQRLFYIINYAFIQKISTFEDRKLRHQLQVQSIIMVISIDDIKKLLHIFLSDEKTDEAINLLTLKVSDSFIDILYKPLIEAGQFIVIAPALAALSNIPRNIITSNQLHSYRDLKNDPMELAVCAALSEVGFIVERNFEFKFDNKCETDIMALHGDHLFVFECKNPYHPCSAHEMRNTYAHLKKGQEQLDIRVRHLRDPEFQKRLFKSVGWDYPPARFVYSAIINANRAFSGYTMGSHPIRQAHELINVLKTGTIGRGSQLPPIKFWKSENFQVSDLADYLEGNSIISTQLNRLTPHKVTIPFGKFSLVFEQYTQNTNDINEMMESNFRTSLGDTTIETINN